jgi:AraC-like DNA-binding protein
MRKMRSADVSSLRMLRRARDRIDRDHAEPIGIPALAAAAGYSREHFIRAFRAAYGETPAPRPGVRAESRGADTTARSA